MFTTAVVLEVDEARTSRLIHVIAAPLSMGNTERNELVTRRGGHSTSDTGGKRWSRPARVCGEPPVVPR